ncbi:histidine phosphatase superfamily protein [Nitzschia inconspicua]|uniref:Histidine phosphatase superfamily protein n=1 Tax=Nitzschia inconspicua TaxID=303405 RepID=A0A9K3LV05_9STRA|nr:histidine phosphatase superfamily protein [Nitzschia inconspicua]
MSTFSMTETRMSMAATSTPVIDAITMLLMGVAIGASLTWTLTQNNASNGHRFRSKEYSKILSYQERKRQRLPDVVILVRHGESEGNVDKTLWWEIPDNKIRLTETGRQQAIEVGKRIEQVFTHYETKLGLCMQRIHIHASPFERTLETSRLARPGFGRRVVRQNLCARLREQEFGNMQSADFKTYREEQKRVGRFWYRFPTGESGADVFDRVKSWWENTLLMSNERWGYDRVDAAVVFTHGLTMRFCLMQLYSWSPTTFHTVYNVANCGIYVLRKDLTIPGTSPYVLDAINGDVPESSIEVLTTFRKKGTDGSSQMVQKIFKLRDYLNVPPPRMTRLDIIKEKLVAQFPDEIDRVEDIESIRFQAFTQRYAPDSVLATPEQLNVPSRTSLSVKDVENKVDGFLEEKEQPHAVPEASNRWPIFKG